MICPNCGAEIGQNKVCGFCGNQISYQMQREQEQINKAGCPKCGSSNVQFRRENQGQLKGSYANQVIYQTVGLCKDCGNTWYVPNPTAPQPQQIYQNPQKQKSNMVWWVLGWIFFFPAPVMVLIWRKKCKWDIKVKIGVTIAFWLLIFILGSCGDSSSSSTDTTSTQVEETRTVETKEEKDNSSTSEPDNKSDTGQIVEETKDQEKENGEADEAEPATSTMSKDEEIKVLLEASEDILKQNYGNDYSIDYSDNLVTINVWKDGVAVEAQSIQAGTASKDDWDYVITAMKQLSESIYKVYKPYGVDVNLNVLNDVNKDNTLLSFFDGIKTYDALE